MTTRSLGRVVQHLRRAALLQEGGLTDGELLGQFLADGNEAAFAALVRRHGSMVLGVCRRVLGHEADAEDAFQATFLVLIRRAAAVVPRDQVGNWLYGVAYRTALQAKGARARRQAKEGQVTPRPAAQDLLDEAAQRERLQLLDQELARLPQRYRVAVVLCDLEGKTHKEAARLLGCPEATLSTRLLRARKLLARRLSARGLAWASGTLALLLSGETARAGLPSPLVSSTVHAATAVAAGQAALVATPIAALAEGVVKAMLLTRLKALVVVVALGLLALGVGLGQRRVQAERPAAPAGAGEKPAPRARGPAEGDTATLRRLEAVRWQLLRVEVGKRTLHIADVPAARAWRRDFAGQLLASAEAQLSLRGLPVAADARITLDGKEVPLKDLHPGVNLSLKFAKGKPVVTAIEAKTPARAGYVVQEVNAGTNTIRVSRGKGDRRLVLTVARGALLDIASLKDLKVGMHVALHIEVVDGKLIVKGLRLR
jgi:RNA polymerase sigma factor (sigma-70 family)